MTMQGVYVTGTDTGIGKTVSSCALLHALRGQGVRAVGMKPVASGCERIAGEWRNEDALALMRASDVQLDYAAHNPHALPAATAPQLAARDAGVSIDLAVIEVAYARLSSVADCVVVEGVGGWAAPLADDLEQADVVRALRLPVVLVVGIKLGCLSHARLSARAIQADGFHLLGWIGNHVDPSFDRGEDYLGLLEAALDVPCLGVVPHGEAAVRDARLQMDRLRP